MHEDRKEIDVQDRGEHLRWQRGNAGKPARSRSRDPGQAAGRHSSERPLSSSPTLASPDCRHDRRIFHSTVNVHHTLVLVCGISAGQAASIVVSLRFRTDTSDAPASGLFIERILHLPPPKRGASDICRSWSGLIPSCRPIPSSNRRPGHRVRYTACRVDVHNPRSFENETAMTEVDP